MKTRESGMLDIPGHPTIVLTAVKSRRFDLLERSWSVRCPVCGMTTVFSLATHAGSFGDRDHLALFIMES